jgi:hypothetical protein
MAKVTSSSNRSKRKTDKPVTKGQNPQRANRQAASQAKVSTSGQGTPGSAKVTTGQGGGASKPSGRQPRAITNGNSPAMRQIRAKAVQARRQAQGKPVATKGKAVTLPNSARAGQNLPRQGAQQMRTIGDSGQVRAAAKRGQEIRKAAQAARGAKQAMGRMGSTLARARFARGPASAIAGAVAGQALSPLATKAGQALGRALKPAARKLDDTLPGINSRDEARRRNAQAAAKGSTSRFKGAREAAVKKASAIKGSPVVGPRKASSGGASSFDSSFAAARKAGKSTFTWRGKKYNTKLRGE